MNKVSNMYTRLPKSRAHANDRVVRLRENFRWFNHVTRGALHPFSSTMPSSKATKKLSPEQKRIAELERQVLDQGKTIGML
jgi:hypothetical protein